MASQPLPRPEKRRGFSPFPNEALPHWSRLVSGDAQVFTVMLIVSETLGAVRDRGTDPPYWSRMMTNAELAGFSRCTVRAIELAVNDLVARKVIERKKGKYQGEYSYHVAFDAWASLPDRPPKVVSISGDAEEAEEETDDDAARATGEVIPVFEKPQRVKGGARPRAKELPRAAAKLRLTSNGEIEYMASMCGGVLWVDLKVTAVGESGTEKRNGSRNSVRNTLKANTTDVSGFEEFRVAASGAGLSFSRHDLAAAEKAWAALPADDRAAALAGLVERANVGEFSNPTYRPLPQNYLLKRIWERAVRKPAGRGRSTDAERQQHYSDFLSQTRERDKKRGA